MKVFSLLVTAYWSPYPTVVAVVIIKYMESEYLRIKDKLYISGFVVSSCLLTHPFKSRIPIRIHMQLSMWNIMPNLKIVLIVNLIIIITSKA